MSKVVIPLLCAAGVGLLAFIIYMAATAPSCEDLGKRTVLLHHQPTVIMVGKVPVVHLIPVYACQ